MEIIDQDSIFLQEWGLASALVEKSGLSVDTLRSIVQDYKSNQLTLLDEAEYIAKKSNVVILYILFVGVSKILPIF